MATNFCKCLLLEDEGFKAHFQDNDDESPTVSTYEEDGATYEKFNTSSFTDAYSSYFACDWMLVVSHIGSIISSNWKIPLKVSRQ